jgi:hypothetical protein
MPSKARPAPELSTRARRRLSAPVHVAAAATLAICCAPALAQAATVPTTVTFPQSYPLAQARTYVVQGTSTPQGGCQPPPVEGRLAPTQQALEIREIAVDTQTCQVTMESGTPSVAELEAESAIAPKTSSSSASSSAVASAARHRTPRAHAADTYYGGYVYARQKDPVGIVVTSVNVTANFWSNGSCTYGGNREEKETWYGPSGWIRLNSNWHQGVSCADSYSSQFDEYYNEAFPPCIPAPLYVYYNRTAIFGYPSGELRGYWPLYTNGAPCGSLLSYAGFLTRTH